MIARRIRGRGWLAIALALAATLSVALLASTPMYADGVLQRLLTRDLERHQERSGRYPGTAVVEIDLYALRRRAERAPYVHEINKELSERLVPALRVPTIAEMRQLRMDYLYDIRPSDQGETKVFARVEAIEHLDRHVTITHGRMFEPAADAPLGDGTDLYDVIVTAEAFRELELQLGRTYQLHDLLGHVPRLRITVVGVFTKSDPRDPFWFGRFSRLSTSYLIDFSTFERDFLETEARNMTRAYWHYAIDYHELTIRDVPNVMRRHADYVRLAAPAGVSFTFAIAPLLESYLLRAATLQRTLSFLQIPSALLLLLFVAMLSQLVIDGDRNEIAVLKSRGAGGRQILSAYVIEALLLGAIGLLLGLPLAVLIVRVIGASNGFLDFVARPALPLLLSWRMLGFALLGVAIFVGSLVLPLVRATGVSIVGLKSRHARAPRSLPWQRYLLDVLLLAVAGYAFFSFRQRREIQELIPAESAPLDPLLFLASTAFILGAGLLTLRLFPIAVRAVFRLGRRLWSPALYAGLVQVSRSRGREYFAMIFLIFTLGMGLASSTTARTMNQSTEDDISYLVGADIALLPEFQSDAPPESAEDLDPLALLSARTGTAPAVQYRAPPLGPFRALPGVERLTTVFRASSASMVIPGNTRVALQVMGGGAARVRPHHLVPQRPAAGPPEPSSEPDRQRADRHPAVGRRPRSTWRAAGRPGAAHLEAATADPGGGDGLRRLLAHLRPDRHGTQATTTDVRRGQLRLRVRQDGYRAVRAVGGSRAGRAERPALRRRGGAGVARPGDPGHHAAHHRGQERPAAAGHQRRAHLRLHHRRAGERDRLRAVPGVRAARAHPAVRACCALWACTGGRWSACWCWSSSSPAGSRSSPGWRSGNWRRCCTCRCCNWRGPRPSRSSPSAWSPCAATTCASTSWRSSSWPPAGCCFSPWCGGCACTRR